jgi:hypothetical protein
VIQANAFFCECNHRVRSIATTFFIIEARASHTSQISTAYQGQMHPFSFARRRGTTPIEYPRAKSPGVGSLDSTMLANALADHYGNKPSTFCRTPGELLSKSGI